MYLYVSHGDLSTSESCKQIPNLQDFLQDSQDIYFLQDYEVNLFYFNKI